MHRRDIADKDLTVAFEQSPIFALYNRNAPGAAPSSPTLNYPPLPEPRVTVCTRRVICHKKILCQIFTKLNFFPIERMKTATTFPLCS